MDALFQTQSNELSTTTQKEKLFKDAERQWNTLSTEKGAPGRKVDFEIYKSILYNLEIRKVYLDSKLSLEKFSSIVGTNTTYLRSEEHKSRSSSRCTLRKRNWANLPT